MYCTHYQQIQYELLKRDTGKSDEFTDFLLRRQKTFILDNLTLTHNEYGGRIRVRIGSFYRSVVEFSMELQLDDILNLINVVNNPV